MGTHHKKSIVLEETETSLLESLCVHQDPLGKNSDSIGRGPDLLSFLKGSPGKVGRGYNSHCGEKNTGNEAPGVLWHEFSWKLPFDIKPGPTQQLEGSSAGTAGSSA